jgi:hypothetical protein
MESNWKKKTAFCVVENPRYEESGWDNEQEIHDKICPSELAKGPY